MSCAKFLSVSALCAGLATFALPSRGAQPGSDYDLEPLMRRYSLPSAQVVTSDNDSLSEMMPAADGPSSSKTSGTPHLASPVSYDVSDNDSNLCDQKAPARLPSSTNPATAHAWPAARSDWPTPASRHGVKQAEYASQYGVAADDANAPPMPTGPRSAPARQPQPPAASSAMNSDSGNSQHDMPEIMGQGCESSECSECVDDDCCCFNPCGNCGWFAGADYLLVRPDFSDAPAFVKITGELPATTNYKFIPQKFDYQSSVRAFFGYRDECGDEIRFTYWHLKDGGSQTVTGDVTDVAYGGQFMTRANEPGDVLTNTVGLEMNTYDIDYVKCCCNPCGCQSCCCPVWTLSYSAGVRIASERRTDNTIQSLATPTSEPTAGFINASFVGAGPRVGIEGHRYFGHSRASLFARSHLALLLGEYDSEQTVLVTTPNTAITRLVNNHDRIIPMADIEIGGDWQMTCRLKLSAGYLFQAWWDLGEFEHVDVNGAGFIQPEANSNILGFDGLFARIEYSF